ncbi:MAG: hypothetical protein RL102_735 [Actinomycetota bacterium]|jgi:RimJ/RimL family protein N-acetyltransferase/predicted SprT family Zn-dependent metalloprotease
MTIQAPAVAPTLRGGVVTLAQLSEHVLTEYLEMLADEEVSRWTGPAQSFTEQRIIDWLTTRREKTDRMDWAVFDNASGDFAGEVVLNEYDEKKHAMNIRIALRSGFLGRGLGTESMRLATEFALEVLKLEKVTLSVMVDNDRAHRAYAKVGYSDGRQYNDGKYRYQRMSCDRFDFVQAMAEDLMREHLDVNDWSFGFDSAKRRAGLCSYTDRRISISKYLVSIHSLDESRQVMLHEIAHALSGKAAGHGKKWLATAKSIGYRAERFSGKEIAEQTAPWVGYCPAGHEHFRYRKPRGESSCGVCARGFSRANLIRWQHRED